MESTKRIVKVKPPLGTETTTRKPESKSPAKWEAQEKTAERKEAASAQAVKMGQPVTMIEVPNEEDDTSFRQWEETEANKRIRQKMGYTTPRVTLSTVATPKRASAKAKEVPNRWLKTVFQRMVLESGSRCMQQFRSTCYTTRLDAKRQKQRR